MCTMYMIYIACCIVLQLVYMVHAANYIVQYSGPLCKVQHTLHIREHPSKKRTFFGESFPKCGWLAWLIPKQSPNSSTTKKSSRKSPFSSRSSPFVFPNLTKTLGWVGGLGKQIWENFPKKRTVFLEGVGLPLLNCKILNQKKNCVLPVL